jgi:prepilin-type N-terminal cleavage/methylation domain-containing protein
MIRGKLRGFTLVELLVVITIIGILASLITVAAVAALRKARETEIKAEINQMVTAFEEYKIKTMAYPPNGQNDGIPQTERPLDDLKPYHDLKRHMKQAFPRHHESENLILVLSEIEPRDQIDYPDKLSGGICGDEAIVFWLGGFSSDAEYPISGVGGPSYPIPAFDDPTNRTLDPIESRKWNFPFDITRLGPRAEDGYFDDTTAGRRRYIEYRDPKGIMRRINFWNYRPRKSGQPYVYFDTSRHPAAVVEEGEIVSRYDPPARTVRAVRSLPVYAFKRASTTSGSPVPIEFINPAKFQIMHCGIDDEWGEEFNLMTAHGVEGIGRDTNNVDDYLHFPNGPFSGEMADTIVNFTSETRIEDAQK